MLSEDIYFVDFYPMCLVNYVDCPLFIRHFDNCDDVIHHGQCFKLVLCCATELLNGSTAAQLSVAENHVTAPHHQPSSDNSV